MRAVDAGDRRRAPATRSGRSNDRSVPGRDDLPLRRGRCPTRRRRRPDRSGRSPASWTCVPLHAALGGCTSTGTSKKPPMVSGSLASVVSMPATTDDRGLRARRTRSRPRETSYDAPASVPSSAGTPTKETLPGDGEEASSRSPCGRMAYEPAAESRWRASTRADRGRAAVGAGGCGTVRHRAIEERRHRDVDARRSSRSGLHGDAAHDAHRERLEAGGLSGVGVPRGRPGRRAWCSRGTRRQRVRVAELRRRRPAWSRRLTAAGTSSSSGEPVGVEDVRHLPLVRRRGHRARWPTRARWNSMPPDHTSSPSIVAAVAAGCSCPLDGGIAARTTGRASGSGTRSPCRPGRRRTSWAGGTWRRPSPSPCPLSDGPVSWTAPGASKRADDARSASFEPAMAVPPCSGIPVHASNARTVSVPESAPP